jgi:hypothetical protein
MQEAPPVADDACTFCGSAATNRAFLAHARSSSAAICNVCLAVCFRRLEMNKGLAPSPGVGRMIGDVEMWPLERELRRFNHVYGQARRTLRGKLASLLGRAPRGTRRSSAPLSALFVQHVHPLATFERQCAMCHARDQLIPSPKGARICEPCVETWTRTLLG